VFQIVQVLGN